MCCEECSETRGANARNGNERRPRAWRGAPVTRTTEVINIMAALKESMQARGREKVRDAVRKRMGEFAPKSRARDSSREPKAKPSRTAH